jgi:transposase
VVIVGSFPAPPPGRARRSPLPGLAPPPTRRVKPGRPPRPHTEGRTDPIEAALAAQTVTVPAEETTGRVIRELAQELDRLADRRDRLAGEIEQLFTSHPQAPVLLSIPGIGVRTGARILTEIRTNP